MEEKSLSYLSCPCSELSMKKENKDLNLVTKLWRKRANSSFARCIPGQSLAPPPKGINEGFFKSSCNKKILIYTNRIRVPENMKLWNILC